MERRSRKYSDEVLDSYKATFEPKYGRPISDFEAEDGLNNLTGFFETLLRWQREDEERRARGEPDPPVPAPPKLRPKKRK
ncbi:MAG: hypothetical protein ACOZNI_25560 [Myxococcota bacterium]